jgi:hypothetical protein
MYLFNSNITYITCTIAHTVCHQPKGYSLPNNQIAYSTAVLQQDLTNSRKVLFNQCGLKV